MHADSDETRNLTDIWQQSNYSVIYTNENNYGITNTASAQGYL